MRRNEDCRAKLGAGAAHRLIFFSIADFFRSKRPMGKNDRITRMHPMEDKIVEFKVSNLKFKAIFSTSMQSLRNMKSLLQRT